MDDMSEAHFQQRIVAYARLNGWLVSHVQSVTMAGKGGRVIRQTPAAKGFPDLTLARDGQVWFMEVKSEKGSVSEDQRAWLNAMSGRVTSERWASRGERPSLEMHDGWSVGVVVVRPRHWEWILEVLR
jgi:hypothetical protein